MLLSTRWENSLFFSEYEFQRCCDLRTRIRFSDQVSQWRLRDLVLSSHERCVVEVSARASISSKVSCHLRHVISRSPAAILAR